MRNPTKFLGALAVAGIVAVGGTAFTASNTGMPATDTLGYGATTVSGATVNSLTYNYNTAQSSIDSVTLVLDDDTTLAAVTLGFNDAAPVTCGTGTYVPVTTTETTYTCAGANFPQSVSTLTKTAVVVD
ncbi:MAG TPA: hypothetical protein VFD59_09875 [Nocardioidaceae bacterium]|nr:hypothetical protein [Nocardioidaceae bacterium]